jgi:hypothetical protein
LINLAKKIDSSYDLEIGTSLSELRVLFAQRYFKFDLKLNYKDLVPPNIQLGNLTTWEEVRYVANQ